MELVIGIVIASIIIGAFVYIVQKCKEMDKRSGAGF